MDSAPTLEMEEGLGSLNKQQVKKSMFSPYKILLALAVFFMLVMASYKVYSELSTIAPES